MYYIEIIALRLPSFRYIFVCSATGAPGLRVLKPEKKKLTEINGLLKKERATKHLRGKYPKKLIMFIPQNF
jgi:hypothetical protein